MNFFMDFLRKLLPKKPPARAEGKAEKAGGKKTPPLYKRLKEGDEWVMYIEHPQTGKIVRTVEGHYENYLDDWPTPSKAPSLAPTTVPTRRLTPTTTPTPSPAQGFKKQLIDFSNYKDKDGRPLAAPPQEYADLFFKYFGERNEATPAAAVTYGENRGYNPAAVNKNANQTTDYGLMQINSGTFDGMKAKPYWRTRLEMMGVPSNTPYEALYDPETNIKVGRVVREYEEAAGAEPFSWWYGWQAPPLGIGINLRENLKKLKK